MPPFNLCKKPTASLSFLGGGIQAEQLHTFQPSCQSLSTEVSTAKEPIASALPEASGSDENLPDIDHVLESQHAAAKTSTGAQGSLLGQILPPTPVTTPIKPQKHTPTYTNPLRTPPVTRIVPTAIRATPPRTSKRPHITHSDGDDDDDDDELPITPSKRARNRRTTANAPRVSSIATLSPPPTPVSTSTTSKRARISSFEIRRIKVSVMKQVRWKKVALHVACNRSASVYERWVQGAFDAWMKDTIEEEGKEVSSQDTKG
ncbi:MAG: hypothetical protein Q9197_006719 [Variospora fuerteventurae]